MTMMAVVCMMVVLCIASPQQLASAAYPEQRTLSFQSTKCCRKSLSKATTTVAPLPRWSDTRLASSAMDDSLERQLAKARELLAISKAKLQIQEASRRDEDAQQDALPFFATLEQPSGTQDNVDKRSIVVKTRDEKSGLITTDGELMAKLSESEKWERRSIWEVFDQQELLAESVREEMEKQLQRTDDTTKKTSRSLNDRDVAASIFNLRKVLQKEDYKKIFDPNNRFIGEDN